MMGSFPSLFKRLRTRRATWITILLLILLIGTFFRLYRLDQIPPGLTHDEAGHGHDAIAILHGARPIYETVGYGREPLYDYWVAGLMAVGGPTSYMLRFASVPLGLATLLLTYAWIRLAFDDLTALIATAFQAGSFWSLAISRQALRSSLLPVFFTAAIYVYWRLITSEERSSKSTRGLSLGYTISFALLVGATFYIYLPARVLWILFPVFFIYLFIFHREVAQRTWASVLVGLLGGLLLAIPLFAYLRAHPGVEQRLSMLDEPLRALWAGDLSTILTRVWSGATAFFLPGHGDNFIAYNIPGRPFLDPLTGALFLIGLGLCIIRWRRPAWSFSPLWFLIGISPTLVTGAMASTTRSIAALPVTFLFPALAVREAIQWMSRRWGERSASVAISVVGILLALNSALSAHDYFIEWGQSPDVRAAYQRTLVEMASYLDSQPYAGTVALSTVYPQAPHDPYVFQMSLQRQDLVTRWFDARRAMVIPPSSKGLVLAPSSAALDPYFANLDGLGVEEQVMMRTDDLDPYFLVYHLEPEIALDELQERARGTPLDLTLPVNFDDAIQFLGYDLRTPTVAPGGTVELVTFWRVTDPTRLLPSRDWDGHPKLVLFAHALDTGGSIVGQQDSLDAPAWDWAPGDVIAQIHRFTLASDLAPGPIPLEIGVYHQDSLERLSVIVNGAAVADRVLLDPLEVENR